MTTVVSIRLQSPITGEHQILINVCITAEIVRRKRLSRFDAWDMHARIVLRI